MQYTLRKATMEDAEQLLSWKNDPVTRQFAIVTHDEIKLENHLIWLSDALDNSSIELLVIIDGHKNYGDIRFDFFTDYTEISVRIEPAYRKKEIASIMLTEAIHEYFYQSSLPLIAKIVNGNIASFRLFIGLGFNVIDYNEKGYYSLERVE